MNDECFFLMCTYKFSGHDTIFCVFAINNCSKNVKIEIKNFETEPKISFYSVKTSKRIFNFHSYICRCKNSKKMIKLKFIPIGNGHRNLF